MIPMSDYEVLDEGLYEISYGTVLGRRIGYEGGFTDLGDVDGFSLNLDPQKKQRFGKKGRSSYLATEATIRIDSQITGKFMQKTSLVRGASLAGVNYDVSQAAGPVAAVSQKLAAGEFFYIGAYRISKPKVQYTKGPAPGTLTALPNERAELVDAALGVIKVVWLPDDALIDDSGLCVGTVDAIDAGSDKRIDIGSAPRFPLELIVRNESDIGIPGYLHIWKAKLSSDGEIGFVTSNDDYEGISLKGRAVQTFPCS